MKLFELLEDLSASEIKGIEQRLNQQVYMPRSELAQGGDVLKLQLPTDQHFGNRATGDNTGRLKGETSDYTADQVEDLLLRARMDPSLGYQDDLERFASYPGPGDYPPTGHGYQILDPKTKLKIPVVVKKNPAGKQLLTKTTVATNKGIEPRNVLKAKTIMFHRPRQNELPANNKNYSMTNSQKSKSSFRPPYANPVRRPRDLTGYDDESTD